MISEHLRRHFAAIFLIVLVLIPGSRAGAGQRDPGDAPAKGRPWLGIIAQAITPDLRESMSLPKVGGVLIGQVIAGSPASKSGLEEGDVILALDGKATDDARSVSETVAAKRPGDSLRVRYVHDGGEKTMSVTLGERPGAVDEANRFSSPRSATERGGESRESRRYRGSPRMMSPADDGPRIGIRIHPLNKDLAAYFDVPESGGVLVLEVMADSPAGKAGVRAGDIVREVDGKKVPSPEELVRAIARAGEGDAVRLAIRRKGRDLSISVTPEAPDREERSSARPGLPGMMRLGPGGPGWSRDHDESPGRSGAPGEIDALRDEVRKLREEVESMKSHR